MLRNFACIEYLELVIYCELAERTSIREANELLFNVLVLEQGVSQKLSIFDIWCIEQKMFVFTWLSMYAIKKIQPGPAWTWR